MTTQIEKALERCGLRGARAQRLRQGFVRVFRVTHPAQGEFCLRMYDLPADDTGPSGARPGPSLGQLRAQLRWLSDLARETVLPVPEPVPAEDGSPTSYVHFGKGPNAPGRHCVLLRWVPGESKREELSQADLSALGSYVGGLHNHAERYAPPEPSALPRWDWGWPFGEAAPLWSEGERFYSAHEIAVFEAVARRVHGGLRELGYGSDAFGPIHRDLHLGNVVFDGGRPAAIDFDKSGMGHYLLDLSILLNFLRLRLPKRFEGARRALLEGYERERPLPAGYRGHLMTFHAILQVARVNRELRATGSQGNRHRTRNPHLLRDRLDWLRRRYLEGGM
jgi:Ser/Thr protein kinase RdoA (MazF antagonist)